MDLLGFKLRLSAFMHCVAASLFLAWNGQAPAQEQTGRGTGFIQLQLPARQGYDGASLGLQSCKASLPYKANNQESMTLALCDEPRRNSKANFGLRLFVIREAQGERHIVFRAPEGGGDAYSIKVTAYQSVAGPAVRLLFVDYAAEFHYGTMVFVEQPEARFKQAGRIDWVDVDEDKQPKSPVEAIILHATPRGFTIGFDRKLFLPQKDGSLGALRSVMYTFDSAKGKLTLASSK